MCVRVCVCVQGEVMTSGGVSIDRETVSEYTLTVLACQHHAAAVGGACASNISTTLSIIVLDVNDNSPQFVTSVYLCTVVSDAVRASRVCHLTARDRDAPGLNSLVTYSLDTHSRLFSVDALTGWVTVIDSLIEVGEAELTLWVVAEDHGSPARSSTTSVHVRVLSHRRRPVITAPRHNASVLVAQVHTDRQTHTQTYTETHTRS